MDKDWPGAYLDAVAIRDHTGDQTLGVRHTKLVDRTKLYDQKTSIKASNFPTNSYSFFSVWLEADSI
jgi:hypothetical protein